MKLVKSAAPAEYSRVYRARIDSVWRNAEFEEGSIVMEEYAVIRKARGIITLDRPCAATNGLTRVDQQTFKENFHDKYGDAILHLYARFHARLDAAIENEDVITGKISEGAAILVGLN
jgi:hypothetical protein